MAAAVETKLYVTNFPSSATRQQLQQFFSRFGRVQECAIMWNSYAFVHYATMEEARRALEQSNGAMFLNRKLIVQLSTSRFRPQPKENNSPISPTTQQLMMNSNGSYHHHHQHSTGGPKTLPQQQLTPLTSQYPYSDLNYDLMTSSNHRQPPQSSSSPPTIPENSNFFRPPSPLSQDMPDYYSQYSNMPIDRMAAAKLNAMKLNKPMKTDMGLHGEIPKLYCTNLPENCKAHDLQRLFSSFGQVTDCVILWDYYAFITYKSFFEAESALMALNGFTWKDRNLIVEWARASGRRQQQQSSPTPPRLVADLSTSSSPRTRPSTLLTHSSASNDQFYGNTSPHKSQSFNQNLTLMSMMQQQSFLHHSSMPYQTESLSNDNQPLFDSLTNASGNHRLDLSPFLESNSNTLFSSSSELNTPSSAASTSNVYQPSDIVALLEPSSSDGSTNNKSMENTLNDLSQTVPTTNLNQVPPSCSSAALFQENLLSSLFNSFEPFNKFFPNEDSSSNSRYNHLSPLLTTAPSNNHSPMSYGHNISWR